MSHHKKALDALLLGEGLHANAMRDLHKKSADNLSVFEAIYYLCIEDGVQVVGSPESAFATFNSALGIVSVYSREPKYIDVVPYQTRSILTALTYSLGKGAQFSTNENEIICTIGSVSARGTSYGEAALRALITYQRLGLPGR